MRATAPPAAAPQPAVVIPPADEVVMPCLDDNFEGKPLVTAHKMHDCRMTLQEPPALPSKVLAWQGRGQRGPLRQPPAASQPCSSKTASQSSSRGRRSASQPGLYMGRRQECKGTDSTNFFSQIACNDLPSDLHPQAIKPAASLSSSQRSTGRQRGKD